MARRNDSEEPKVRPISPFGEDDRQRPVQSAPGAAGPSENRGDDPRLSVEHRLRRLAGATARRPAPRLDPRIRRRMLRGAVIFLIAAVAGIVLAPFGDVPNAEHPEARDVADRIDAAWRSVTDGSTSPEEAATAAGLRVRHFEVGGRPRTIITTAEPTATGTCYAIRFGEGVVTQVGTVAVDPDSGCEPHATGILLTRGSWSSVLPSERVTPRWFVPLVTFVLLVALVAAIDVTIVLISKRR